MKPSMMSLTAMALSFACFTNAHAATWDGFYMGANAGTSRTEATFHTGPDSTGTYFATTSVPSINSTGAGSDSDRSLTTGLTLGYNAQSNSFVSGIETDLDYMHNKISRTNTATYPCCSPSTYTLNQFAKTNGLLTIRGRTGFAFGDSLIYVTGGVAMTSLKTGYNFSDNFGLNAQSSSSKTNLVVGWILGTGYEFALPANLSVKAEFLYADFGNVFQNSSMIATGSSAQFSQTTTKIRTKIFRLGLNKKF